MHKLSLYTHMYIYIYNTNKKHNSLSIYIYIHIHAPMMMKSSPKWGPNWMAFGTSWTISFETTWLHLYQWNLVLKPLVMVSKRQARRCWIMLNRAYLDNMHTEYIYTYWCLEQPWCSSSSQWCGWDVPILELFRSSPFAMACGSFP